MSWLDEVLGRVEVGLLVAERPEVIAYQCGMSTDELVRWLRAASRDGHAEAIVRACAEARGEAA